MLSGWKALSYPFNDMQEPGLKWQLLVGIIEYIYSKSTLLTEFRTHILPHGLGV